MISLIRLDGQWFSLWIISRIFSFHPQQMKIYVLGETSRLSPELHDNKLLQPPFELIPDGRTCLLLRADAHRRSLAGVNQGSSVISVPEED